MLELQNSPSDHVAVTRLRLRKREFVILTPKIHSCDWCLSMNNEHENRHILSKEEKSILIIGDL